jgi:hypothetical protein
VEGLAGFRIKLARPDAAFALLAVDGTMFVIVYLKAPAPLNALVP